MGVISYLEEMRNKSDDTEDKIATFYKMPMSYFQNTEFESRSGEQWKEYIQITQELKEAEADQELNEPNLELTESGIPARAMCAFPKPPESENDPIPEYPPLTWKACTVIDYDVETDKFTVVFKTDKLPDELAEVPAAKKAANKAKELGNVVLESLYVCFDVEDPEIYALRLTSAIENKTKAFKNIAMNLYIDCMPVDNLKPLDSEQVNRILMKATNIDRLRTNYTSLDTNTLLSQYNLNHMRTLNHLIFLKLVQTQQKEVQRVKAYSTDHTLLVTGPDYFVESKMIEADADLTFTERIRKFKFKSLYNSRESSIIFHQINNETRNIENINFFAPP